MTEPSSELNPETAVTVGRIVAAHGVRGEMKVQPLTDFPKRFRRGAYLWLNGARTRVRSSRPVGRLFYIILEGVNDREAVDALRDAELQVPEAEPLVEDVFYQHDIVGLAVETADGEALGKVESIFSTGANDVYVVRGERGELLLPAVEDVVKEIDVAGGRLRVELLPGLEFIAPAAPRERRRRPQPSRRRRPAPAPEGNETPGTG